MAARVLKGVAVATAGFVGGNAVLAGWVYYQVRREPPVYAISFADHVRLDTRQTSPGMQDDARRRMQARVRTFHEPEPGVLELRQEDPSGMWIRTEVDADGKSYTLRFELV